MRWHESLWPLDGLLVLCLSAAAPVTAAEAGEAAPTAEKVPPPPPYVFSLGGLKPDEVEGLKKVPGVEKVEAAEGRTRVVWQAFNDQPWESRKKRIKGSERIADFLAIRGKVGKTNYVKSGPGVSRAGPIVLKTMSGVTLYVRFCDESRGNLYTLNVRGYCEALPGQVEHEMLRDVVGTQVAVEKCGDGYAAVSTAGRGTFVVWQVNEQMFARIDDFFDREVVAAYVNRLGSITPKDCDVSVGKWVKNEIRWRVGYLDIGYAWDAQGHTDGVDAHGCKIMATFPEIYARKGRPGRDQSLLEIWEWQNWVRNWLWANVDNFKYDDETRRYILKGKDLYDPAKPPKLPEELRGPPRPEETPK